SSEGAAVGRLSAVDLRSAELCVRSFGFSNSQTDPAPSDHTSAVPPIMGVACKPLPLTGQWTHTQKHRFTALERPEL
ncbi:hypothetical protein M9458_031275, partial [Cirrhinus mrigala]